MEFDTPKPVVSRAVSPEVSLVTAIAEPSSLCARPNGSPGIVTLRVFPTEFGSSPAWWYESHRLSTREPQSSANGANVEGALSSGAGPFGSSNASLAHVTVALPLIGEKR